MEGEGWRVSDEEAEIWQLGNYAIWKMWMWDANL